MNPANLPPPWLAQTMLHWLTEEEYIVGDFGEEFERVWLANGRFQARIWFWRQLFRSTPALGQRRWQIMMATLSRRDKQFLILSMLLLIPALLISLPGVIFSLFGLAGPMNTIYGALESSAWVSWLIHPLTILGGIAGAVLLTAWPVVQFDIANQQDRLVGSLTIRKGYWLHLGVLGTAGLFLLIILIYLLAENFHLFQAIN